MIFQIVEGQVILRDAAGPIGTIQDPHGEKRLQVETSAAQDSVDAFGRLRVAAPSTIFDGKQVFDAAPLHFVQDLASGGTITYNNSRSSSALATTTTTGSKATKQSRRYFNYQPGKSQQVLQSFVASGGGVTNVAKRVGQFDNNDGIYFELNGTTPRFVIRSSGPVSTQTVDQSSWNVDSLNGLGPSGYTIDFSKAQILAIDYEWLGVGVVRVGFVHNGLIMVAHRFNSVSTLLGVYMKSANLPLRWEIETLGTPGGGTRELEMICGTVISEGGQDPVGVTRSADRGLTALTTDNTLRPVISTRLKSAYNRATAFPLTANVVTATGANFYWQAIFNPTITGGTAASWTSVPNSSMEYDVSRTGVVTAGANGIVVASGYAPTKIDAAFIDLRALLTYASDFSGTADELVIAACSLSTQNEDFYGSMNWMEMA